MIIGLPKGNAEQSQECESPIKSDRNPSQSPTKQGPYHAKQEKLQPSNEKTKASDTDPCPLISALILLDMVGDKNLRLLRDLNSSPWLNEIIWNKAAQMGHSGIFPKRGNIAAEDDHLPFAEEGIPVIDIVNLNYEHWHRQEDTLDKLSAQNLTAVGNVLLSSLAEISQYLER